MTTTFLISQIYHHKCASDGTFCELSGMHNSRRGIDVYMYITYLVQTFLNISRQLQLAFLLTLTIIQVSITVKSLTGRKYLFFFYLKEKKTYKMNSIGKCF